MRICVVWWIVYVKWDIFGIQRNSICCFLVCTNMSKYKHTLHLKRLLSILRNCSNCFGEYWPTRVFISDRHDTHTPKKKMPHVFPLSSFRKSIHISSTSHCSPLFLRLAFYPLISFASALGLYGIHTQLPLQWLTEPG